VRLQRFWLLWILFFFVLGGCVPAPAPLVGNPEDMIATIAAATVNALPTTTPHPTWTSSPIPTRSRNTPTDIPSNTPAPTIEVLQLPAPGTPMADLTKLPLGFWSPTPDPFQCDLNKIEPEPYTIFKPRYFFRSGWRVWNRGSEIWKEKSIVFYFIGGDKLHNDEERADGIFLPYTVYPQDKVFLQVAMTSPGEPGTYSATWGLRRENRNTPFCTFQVIIRVK
jgi:hypothetical protein